jgi:plastocyanin
VTQTLTFLLWLLTTQLHTPRPEPRTGSIEGSVRVQGAQRRVAERYLSSGASARSVQPVPPVVYLRAPSSGATPTRQRLVQRDTSFSPAAIAVPVGSVVEFPNEDPFFHNVFSYSAPKRFDLGRYPQGESKSVAFDRAGVVKVYCEVHESMRAAIIVLDHAWFDVVAEDGSFAIRNVPAGRHELVVWFPDSAPRELTVAVREGAVTRIDVTPP